MKNTSLTFTLPSDGNSITENDIKNKQLRITAAFKGLFPEQNDELKITIKNDYTIPFKHKGKRSHILRLGSDALEELGIKAGDKVKFIRIGAREFKMEGVRS
ncbi:hypothetical protein DU508_23220 [Pedobacter chinensis]|uniref:Uncharacterized protein n=1 Tax=Pedobacter chinensis TaxID=2282421 RepID=A0A369PU35_9SPHI|nr:hypothetical protein [Pedobacter chinensis]RDC54146.1 hypothetical protein DU508_23220 [Pedobacter chinensis]